MGGDNIKGKLYGIGTGPGDPELLTIKAVNTIRKCGVIAIPDSGSGERAAFSIIEKYLDGKELIACRFAMDKDTEGRKETRQFAAGRIAQYLDNGEDVGFVTLGDPTTYSTYMYVHEIIVNKGFEAEIIPGVTSYAAAAAAFGIPLCEGGEPLLIIPAAHNESIDDLLDFPGNKVIMKSGGNLAQILKRLKERGYGDRTKIAYRAAMDGQRLYAGIEAYDKSPETGYFTLAIIKG